MVAAEVRGGDGCDQHLRSRSRVWLGTQESETQPPRPVQPMRLRRKPLRSLDAPARPLAQRTQRFGVLQAQARMGCVSALPYGPPLIPGRSVAQILAIATCR